LHHFFRLRERDRTPVGQWFVEDWIVCGHFIVAMQRWKEESSH
jgi:hypothetical protein